MPGSEDFDRYRSADNSYLRRVIGLDRWRGKSWTSSFEFRNVRYQVVRFTRPGIPTFSTID
jgi:hypothetical protein